MESHQFRACVVAQAGLISNLKQMKKNNHPVPFPYTMKISYSKRAKKLEADESTGMGGACYPALRAASVRLRFFEMRYFLLNFKQIKIPGGMLSYR